MPKHFEGKTETEKWEMYVAAVRQRDEARCLAEAAEKKRRRHWREYYEYEKTIKELDAELGISESMAAADTDEVPSAPRKSKLSLKRKIDLTDE